MSISIQQTSKVFNATVIVTALGYLVDVYDILIFNTTRVATLTDLGLSGDLLTNMGIYILNMQLVGLILGGLFFGVMGDKIGRKACLLGSILTYSIATLACAFVTTPEQLAWARFIAGFGLAGEIGIGVALITETMTKEKRTLGVTLFAFIGIAGAVLAALAAEFLPWRICYIIGGVAGLLLLITRTMVLESGLYEKSKEHTHIQKGSLAMILTRPALLKKYIYCIFLGAPIFYSIGMIWTLSPEIGKNLGASEPIKATMAIGLGYLGMMFGDLLAGLLSHRFQNRKTIILYFMIVTCVVIVGLFLQKNITPTTYYIFAALNGLFIGYWVNLITMSAEQFGTNIRATVSTSVPNFARATLLPLNLILSAIKPSIGIIWGVGFMGVLAMVLAFYALYKLEDTYHKDLNYYEE
jgi:MFS transporter, putative metabolite:H+ symporter